MVIGYPLGFSHFYASIGMVNFSDLDTYWFHSLVVWDACKYGALIPGHEGAAEIDLRRHYRCMWKKN